MLLTVLCESTAHHLLFLTAAAVRFAHCRYKDCKVYRDRLSVINAVFLIVLASFTMMICLLLSAAFDDTQCIIWVEKALQSIAMQVLVTGPLIGLLVLCVKVFVSWLLLRANARTRGARRLAELDDQLQSAKLRRFEVAAQLRQLANVEKTDSRSVSHAAPRQQLQDRRWGLMRMLQRITATEVVLEARRAKARKASETARKHGLKRQNSQRDIPVQSDAPLKGATAVTAWSQPVYATEKSKSTTNTALTTLQRIVPIMRSARPPRAAIDHLEDPAMSADNRSMAGFSVRSRKAHPLRTVPQFAKRATRRRRAANQSRRRRSLRVMRLFRGDAGPGVSTENPRNDDDIKPDYHGSTEKTMPVTRNGEPSLTAPKHGNDVELPAQTRDDAWSVRSTASEFRTDMTDATEVDL